MTEALTDQESRIVRSVARRWRGDYDDLCQEGCLAILRARAAYDPARGDYGALAYESVRRAIQIASAAMRGPVRVPWNRACQSHVIDRARARYAARTGEDMPLDALCAETGLSERAVANAEATRVVGSLGLTADRPRLAGRALAVAAAADRCVSDAETRDMLDALPYRTRDIVRRRYGIGDGEEWTLEAIAELHGITRQRVQQIVVGAIDELRGMCR